VGLPSACRRFSASLAAYLLDGVWVFAFPRLAMAATPVAFVVGLIIGITSLGYDVAPFESILLVAAIVVVGTLGAHLGLATVSGLAIGDFFLAGRAWTLDRPFLGKGSGVLDHGLVGALGRERIPLLLGYALLLFVTVGIPVLVKTMLAQLPIRDKDDGNAALPGADALEHGEAVESETPSGLALSTPAQIVLSVAGHGCLTYFLVGFWVEATPVLLRPIWTWPLDQLSQRKVSLALVQPLQENGTRVIVAAVIASIVRMGLQWHVRLDGDRSRRMSDLQTRLRRHFGAARPPGRPRKLARVVFRAAAGTLLLSGIIPTWADAAVLAAVLLLGGLLQAGIIPVPLGRWPEIAQRIPLLFRVAAAVLFLRIFVQAFAERLVDLKAETFRTFLVVCVLGVFVFLLALPAPRPETRHAKR